MILLMILKVLRFPPFNLLHNIQHARKISMRSQVLLRVVLVLVSGPNKKSKEYVIDQSKVLGDGIGQWQRWIIDRIVKQDCSGRELLYLF